MNSIHALQRFALAIFVIVLAAFTASSAAPPSNAGCVWAGRVYSDGELKLNGRICQVCQAGKWVDKSADCAACRPTRRPDETNPAPSASDCTAQQNPASPQKLTFTDGARVEQADGKFQMCSAGQWIQKEVTSSQLCPQP
jgi:hypothetical protein